MSDLAARPVEPGEPGEPGGSGGSAGPGGTGRRGPLLLVVGLAGFVTTLDNTVVTVALPTLQAELGASLAVLEWVVTGYVLTFSGLMLAGGRLADVYGRRRILVAGLAVFTAASLAAGLAGSAGALVAARLVQGCGAALILPAMLAVVAVAGGGRERSTGVAVWMASGAAALALGPVVGGYLAQHAHWSWIFLLNVPLGVLCVALAAVAVPESRDGTAARVDVPGVAASIAVLSAGTFGLTFAAELGWTSPVILAALAVSVVSAVAFAVVERLGRDPMVDLALFRARAFTGGVIAQVLWGLGVNGVFFFTALFLQGVLGFSPTASGLAFVPLALLVAVVTPLVPLAERRLGAARTVALGLVLVAGGMVAVAFLRAGDGWAELLPAVCVIGIGSALTMPLGSAVLGAVPEGRAGVAGGVFSVAREMSGLFGIAVVGVIVNGAASFTAGYSTGLLTAAGLVAAGAAVSLVTLR
ncbi:DHA2 family efflux MFS transporter permease subunit [Planomonospora parontospora]|uniref:DHA2 family efflux MFS transporter permease subunit n=1 Tax=Planomonospora parontospora TaxID=58119 RepID=UPI001670722C|nr:DHA2 family efflux MFS transporter permease subunit [Planomonospora parontospora]GGL54752.1 MFS transporter [Planomonospora parontospora subsp. antibiotica]GII19752.1 MFS transporter [Planomonospora parontospora subsp. antibiotica]